MGFNVRDQFSGFLKKEDFPRPALMTISCLEQVDIGGEDKVACHFEEANKPMILNKSNGELLCSLFGNDSDGMLGQKVVVYCDPSVMFQGRTVGGLKLRAPKPDKSKKKDNGADESKAELHAAREASAASSLDDDCPF